MRNRWTSSPFKSPFYDHVATDMSVNNPAHPLSPSSQFPNPDPSARPSTSSRPSDQSVRTSDDHLSDGAPPITSPVHDGTPEGQDRSVGDTRDDGADHTESQPSFQPFFTLVEDAHTSEHYHPTVHYIFSDDDTDIITEAALRSLEAQQETLTGSRREGHTTGSSHNPAKQHDNNKSALLPPPIPGVRDNYIVLDVEPVPSPSGTTTDPAAPKPSTAGEGSTKSMSTSPVNPSTLATQQAPSHPSVPRPQYRVTSARSFSSTWQVLSSEMLPAPTFDNHNQGDMPGHGLMLKISGTAGIPVETGKEKEDHGTTRLEDMMDQFAKRMRELQMVIDAADLAPPKQAEHVEERQSPSVEEQNATTDEHS